jgi:beta-glucosidase
VQLYVKKQKSPRPRPLEQLKAFQRVSVPHGEKRSVTLHLAIGELGLWDDKRHAYVVEPGAYELLVGASSADIRQRATINIQ